MLLTQRQYTAVAGNDVDKQRAEKGNSMKKIVRILGRNGVIYEEPMTEEQVKQFLSLLAPETSIGCAFDEWTIEIVTDGTQTADEQRQGNTVSDAMPNFVERYIAEKPGS